MFELGLTFKSAVNILIFFLLAFLSGLWVYRQWKNNPKTVFLPLIVLNSAIILIWAGLPRIYHDESTHLHLGWLISQGLTPYKDFWYHHSPFLWLVLSPFLKRFASLDSIFYLFRIFSGLVFLLNALIGWRIAEKAWQRKASLSLYILVLSSVAILAQFLLLRPDIFMVFFLLAGIYICLDIPGKRVSTSFFAGLAFALAASFLLKQYLLIFLPVIAVFLGGKGRRALKLFLYFLGLLIGCLPLAVYLISNHIFGEYIYWVVYFNMQIVVFLIFFPLPVFILGAWGVYLLALRFRYSKDTKALILFVSFCLSTLSSLTTTIYANRGYYLAFWLFLCAITASGCPVTAVFEKIPSLLKRFLAIGLFFGFLIMPNIVLLRFSWDSSFSRDRETVSKLKDYCSKDTCFTIMPMHPVFAQDATRFYSYSQYLFVDESSLVKDDLMRKDIAAQIIKKRPAVITYLYQERDFILDLFEKGLIDAAGYKKLISFLEQNYTQKQVGKGSFYIRNDKL